MDEFVCKSPVGIGIARDRPASDSDCVLLARQVIFHEFGDVLFTDHVSFDRCHPYIDCLPTVYPDRARAAELDASR